MSSVPAHRSVSPPSPSDLAQAAVTVASVLGPTPLVPAPRLGADVQLKLETAQPTGSFKVRGALAALNQLPADAHAVASSAGNHGLGLAWAATQMGRTATIVVPKNASEAKLAALERFEARVVRSGDSYDAAESHALELALAHGTYVSPYNDTHVIAGQATIGPEIDAFARPLTVVVPVGGGGLLAGMASWARDLERISLIGVEAAASSAMAQALRSGPEGWSGARPTLADGMAGGIEPGAVTVTLARERLDDLVAVDDDAIAAAIRFLAVEHGVVAEGAGAAATAAILSGAVAARGRVVALVTGRNISLERLASVLAGGTRAGAV